MGEALSTGVFCSEVNYAYGFNNKIRTTLWAGEYFIAAKGAGRIKKTADWHATWWRNLPFGGVEFVVFFSTSLSGAPVPLPVADGLLGVVRRFGVCAGGWRAG